MNKKEISWSLGSKGIFGWVVLNDMMIVWFYIDESEILNRLD